MSCIHYKFRNNSKHDTIQFDGSYITVGEIKQAILGQKKMGKAPDFTLQIINAQTQEAYNDDNQLIPRNADVTVKRIPTGNKVSKAQLAAQSQSLDMYKMSNTPLPLSVTMENDLSKTEGSEEDKLKAIMMQQSLAYDNPIVNKRYNKPNPDEEIPLNYICHRCNTPGHLIKNCPTNGNMMYEHRGPRPPRKMTLSLKKTEKAGPEMTAEEKRLMEKNQKTTQDKVKTLAQQAYTNIPTEMKCPICKQLMVDACLTTCCGQSFCDECIRDQLLDEALCPACDEEVSPSQLISNKALRVTINKYKKDNQDQIAKLYSDCHIRPKSRDSTPKPDMIDDPTVHPKVEPVPSSISTLSQLHTKPLIDRTTNLSLNDIKPAVAMTAPPISITGTIAVSLALPAMAPPPVAILDPVEPPPAVAILPVKEEVKEEMKHAVTLAEPMVTREVKSPPPIINPVLPQIATFPTVLPPPMSLSLPPVTLLPFNPVLGGVPGPIPGPVGLLPPPLPLPEPKSPKDRILDPKEFYTIQKELRRLQERRRSRSRSSSHSPVRSRRHSHSPPRGSRGSSAERHRRQREHTRHSGGKRRQESHHRIRIERTARYAGGGRGRAGSRRVGRGSAREPMRALLERKVRNDRARVSDGDRRSHESDGRRSDHSDRRSYEEGKKSDLEEMPPSRDDSEQRYREDSDSRMETNERDPSPPKLESKHKKRKEKEHKKKKHKKKEKKDKKKKKEKPIAEPEIKPTLTEYSATEESSDEEVPRKKSISRSPSPFNPIIAPRQASPSPDRIPTQPSPPPKPCSPPPSKPCSPPLSKPCSPPPCKPSSPPKPSTPPPSPKPSSPPPPPTHSSASPSTELAAKSSPHTPAQATPKPLTPTGTPTATGGVTPQFTNGLSSDDDEDAVSINMNISDREVNGEESSSSDESESDHSAATNLEELRRQYKEAAAQIKQMKEQRLADKKKLKKKKKKKKKSKEDEEKKKKKHKKRKHKEDLEDGEIKGKSTKKRKRSHSERDSQESLEIEVKKKPKKSKHSKEKKEKSESSSKVNFKVNFTPMIMKSMDNGSKTISITSPAKIDSSRRVHIGVSPVKPLKVKSKIDNHNGEENDSKTKNSKSHKKSRHKISKSAVSGIEDDPEGL